ncbi:MAG: hypothetical protein LBD42_01545 [Desulfovibrio sp.]|jgi:hypothetical protein|nr:hypothetical protein [Desulfovibrio sp.]
MPKILLAFMAGFIFFAFSPSAAQAGSLNLVNQSASDIHAIYICDSGADNWEENLIAGYKFPSGNQLTIQIQGSYRSFDLRVEDGEGNSEDYFDFPGNTKSIVIKGGGDSEYQ